MPIGIIHPKGVLGHSCECSRALNNQLFNGFFLNALSSFLCAVAGDLLSELNNNAMVDDTVNGSGRGHGILEYLVPLRKYQIRSDNNAAALVAFSQQSEENLHFITGLLDVADVVEDKYLEAIKAAEFVFKE